MKEIHELITKAKKLKKEERFQEAIIVLTQAHELALLKFAIKELVDIHNQLILLHYLNNNYGFSEESFIFARKVATRINYSAGLIETLMNMAWVETEKKNFLEAINLVSEALVIDEIVENVTINATALYIISKANYGIGEIEKGDIYKKLYQQKLTESEKSGEPLLGSIENDMMRVTKIFKSLKVS